jgi:poly-gamma-glutamate synthesis protein (capsule biosynthesis protein)
MLCGDVMTGRGVDQILPHPVDPRIHESCMSDARDYVALAEAAHGPIPRPVDVRYIWGDALEELERAAPDARIVNLETSVTVCEDFWKGKGITYRMHPRNVDCLAALGADVCVLANNHVLDYGRAGLVETLETLAGAGLRTAGAGRTLDAARRPADVEVPGGARVRVVAFGTETSGIPHDWAAAANRPGVHVLPELSERAAEHVLDPLRPAERANDIVIASVHWGTNWGYDVPAEHVRFARWLVDRGAHIVHGHSSHHVRPIEVYRDRLILYGAGDFINDYEGIEGYEAYRDDLVLMYFATVDARRGTLARLRMTPLQIRRLRLTRAAQSDSRWLQATIDGVCKPFGVRVVDGAEGSLALEWG